MYRLTVRFAREPRMCCTRHVKTVPGNLKDCTTSLRRCNLGSKQITTTPGGFHSSLSSARHNAISSRDGERWALGEESRETPPTRAAPAHRGRMAPSTPCSKGRSEVASRTAHVASPHDGSTCPSKGLNVPIISADARRTASTAAVEQNTMSTCFSPGGDGAQVLPD